MQQATKRKNYSTSITFHLRLHNTLLVLKYCISLQMATPVGEPCRSKIRYCVSGNKVVCKRFLFRSNSNLISLKQVAKQGQLYKNIVHKKITPLYEAVPVCEHARTHTRAHAHTHTIPSQSKLQFLRVLINLIKLSLKDQNQVQHPQIHSYCLTFYYLNIQVFWDVTPCRC